MKNYELAAEEIQALKIAHKTAKQFSAYTAYRIHVIILLGMHMTPAEVSEIILLDEVTVRTYQLKEDGYNKNSGFVLIDAKNDTPAIATFMREYKDSKKTLRSYAKEAEQGRLYESRVASFRPWAFGSTSIKKSLKILDSFFNYLVQTNYLIGNPLAIDRRRKRRQNKPRIIDRYLKLDEIQAVLTALSDYSLSNPAEQFRLEVGLPLFST